MALGVRIVALVKIEIGDRASRRSWAGELVVEGVAVAVAWCIKGCSGVMTQHNPDKECIVRSSCSHAVFPCSSTRHTMEEFR